ncbi:M61 family metallopeptidase [Nannocystis bainbridge]|uniref:PDZ domain-containing protein n=1 Tax=Nannocystis bainbridge TaxID=2995303 RepID=A0ABT5EA19_9BACT|nr:PDZ domain-containing protein [Nannocystis bainbridge]MDC0722199.1 PDZ domain-containing protein [Nannocystis bainbridge]
MRVSPLLLALALGGACATAVAAPAPTSAEWSARERKQLVQYEVALAAPESRWLEIVMTVEQPRGRRSDVALPAWIPGSYLIRDFARNLDGIEVTDVAGVSLPAERLDKQTWRIGHGGKSFRARYRVWADEPGVRTSVVDDRHATLNGAGLFLYLVGETARPAELRFTGLPKDWTVHAALPQPTPGTLRAASYDVLVDSPLELGTPVVHAWDEGGARIELVFSAPAGSNADPERLARELKPLVHAFAVAMGGLPTSRYVFLMLADEKGDGGLEHADSTLMRVPRDMFQDDGGYRRALHLAGHEFFHLWNAKRLRDAALVPYDYAREDYSRLLWFHEGFTETIENQMLVRAGATTPDEFLRELAGAWTAYLQKPGRNHVPLTQASVEAWVKQYKPSPGHHDTTISYYEKGHLAGVCLDLELRLRSHGKGSLVGLFRRLMTSHGARGKGITFDDVVAAASAEAGSDVRDFFRRYVEGTDELPLPAQLARMGVEVEIRAPSASESSPLAARRKQGWSGLLFNDSGIRSVALGSPAALAGLLPGDEIVAVAARRTRTAEEAAERLMDHAPGQSVEVALFRGGRLLQRTLTIAEDPRKLVRFAVSPTAESAVRALRDAWLSTSPK